MTERLNFSPEHPESPVMNALQETALRSICHRYGVPFSTSDYVVYAASLPMMPGYAEGWVGGNEYAGKTIYVGVSPAGEINS